MSHFTTIKTEIYDLDVLKHTLSDLRLSFEEGEKIRAHYTSKEMDLAVHLNSVCIGFRRNLRTKTYEIQAEGWILQRESVQKVVKRIRQEYAYRKILAETRKRGFALIREERVKPDTIKLVLRKVA